MVTFSGWLASGWGYIDGLVWGWVMPSTHLILGVIYPVGFFIYFLNISLVCEKPVPASQQAPAFLFLQPGSMWYVM